MERSSPLPTEITAPKALAEKLFLEMVKTDEEISDVMRAADECQSSPHDGTAKLDAAIAVMQARLARENVTAQRLVAARNDETARSIAASTKGLVWATGFLVIATAALVYFEATKPTGPVAAPQAATTPAGK